MSQTVKEDELRQAREDAAADQRAEDSRREDERRAEERRQEERRKEDERRKKLSKVGGKGNDIGTMAVQDAVGLVGGLLLDTAYIGRTVRDMRDGQKDGGERPEVQTMRVQQESEARRIYHERAADLRRQAEEKVKEQEKERERDYER